MFAVVAAAVAFKTLGGAPEQNAQAAPASEKKAEPEVAAKPAAPPPPREKTWSQVNQWQDNRRKETEIFAITGAEFRINYTTLASKDALESFQVGVYREDSDRMVALPVNVRGEVKDTAYVASGPGRFYLKVTGTVPWTVKVEDKR